MNAFLNSMISTGLMMMSAIKKSNEEWKDRLRQEWRDSMDMPRKKKKLERKRILLDWSIANYDPFQSTFN